ncbi:peptidoglycan recognition protein family protein [Dubosiella newyorkensis]|uniref:peptidoglycan recognition protein family protein n=1 Tax=Dubosiella newyorkensis TaxID=1862672 RepID=UPI00272EE7A8|nr:peptidoglycan recognition family protein [Dubosiella newyorkensis]
MSNSALVNYRRLSPNCSSRNGSKIDKITIHHMAGNLSVETCGNVFAPASRQASSHYGIGSDGRVGQYVDESMRAWTSSSYDNDRRAVTIEVADDSGAPGWHVSDKALAKLIDLCTDICRRNGIKQLVYTGNASGNLTRHDFFAATNCPGPYLGSKFPYIAAEVNKRLSGQASPSKPAGKHWVQDTILHVGDKVKSVSCAITGVKGNLVNVPALGGWVPLADVTEAADTRDGKNDDYLATTAARVFYNEKKVIAIDAARDLCKCEGCDYWIKCGPLMALR